jgi:hypothetical protein
MAQSSGAHAPLRQEWAETSPDLSYRFVVSLGTLQAADAVARAVLWRKTSWWQRALAFFMRDILRLIIGASVLALIGWLALQPALIVDRTLDAAQRLGSGALLPIATFVVTFVVLFAGFRIATRRLAGSAVQHRYREFYLDNEFLLEGRKSHLWFDEQSAGAIRRWSTFGQRVDFDEGMWLFLRRRMTFAGQRGILISKESLPGSCTWSELQAYVSQRIDEGATAIDV